LVAETPDIDPAWKALVGALGVIGKQVHDARLVAVCHVHGVTHLLRNGCRCSSTAFLIGHPHRDPLWNRLQMAGSSRNERRCVFRDGTSSVALWTEGDESVIVPGRGFV